MHVHNSLFDKKRSLLFLLLSAKKAFILQLIKALRCPRAYLCCPCSNTVHITHQLIALMKQPKSYAEGYTTTEEIQLFCELSCDQSFQT